MPGLTRVTQVLVPLFALASLPVAGVVLAEEPVGAGTGVIVNKVGHVLTNAHVIDDCARITVNTTAGVRAEARVVAKDAKNDLAVLGSDLKPQGVAVFRPNKARAGETVAVFGFPLSGMLASSGNVTTGIITALSGLRDDSTRMQVSAPVQPGNSGGPVHDASGRVVGIMVAKLDAIRAARATGDIPQNVNFAIKAGIAVGFLAANDIAYETGELGKDLPVPDIVDQAKTYTARIECYGAALKTATKPAAAPKEDKPKPPKVAGSPVGVVSETVVDRAVGTIVRIILKEGRPGALAAIQGCYGSLSPDKGFDGLVRCMAMDEAATSFEYQLRKIANNPVHPYFEGNAMAQRLTAAMVAQGLTPQQADGVGSKIAKIAVPAIARHMDAEKR